MRRDSGHRKVNGLNLFVHRFRDPDAGSTGLTLLLLHGFLDAGGTWARVAEPLARAGHDVVVPDHRGFGQSDRIGAGGYYHFPDYVADVAALVDDLAPQRLGIIAHSMGGSIAVYYTGTLPERVERLALLEGIGPMDMSETAVHQLGAWLRDLRRVDRTPRALASMDEAVDRLAMLHPRVPRAVVEEQAGHLTRIDEAGRLTWAYDPLHRTTAPTPFYGASFSRFLDRITCPTLFVGGGPTGWHPPEEEERLARLRHVERHDLPDAGHMLHWTAPAELSARLLDFFSPAPPPVEAAPG